MILYDKLRKLPKVIQEEIYETGNVRFLTDDENITTETLTELWAELDEEYKRLYFKKESNDIITIAKEINYQEGRFNIIRLCCDQLRFDWSEEAAEVLAQNNYHVTKDNFLERVPRIEKESESILIKIKQLKDKLPKEQEKEVSIIGLMTSYSLITGINFDFNTVSVEAFHFIENSAIDKIKMLEKQASEHKQNNK